MDRALHHICSSWNRPTMHLVLHILLQLLVLQTVDVQGSWQCMFSKLWRGRWYQGDLGQVTIKENSISGKGHCVDQDEEYYVLHNKEQDCKQCLFMIQRHENVIQYRASFCHRNIHNTKELCDRILIEEPLFTLIRDGARSVPCPFSGRHRFAYRSDTGSCDKPLSHIKPCAGTGKFHFKYANCNLMGSHMFKDREFECLALWKDGSDMFFYGGFIGGSSLQDMYRCFMYEDHGTEFHFSMSADASCRGLMSPQEGPVTYRLFDDGWKEPECIFPEWFRRLRWRDLAGTHYYNDLQEPYHTIDVDYLRHHGSASHHGGKFGHTVTSYRCLSVISMTSKVFTFASFTSHDCNNHYQCIQLRRRNDQVLELHLGKHELREPGSCPNNIFQDSETITLIPEDMHTTSCPFPGMYDVSTGAVTSSSSAVSATAAADETSSSSSSSAVSECSTTLLSGCNGSSVIVIEENCEDSEKSDWLECLSHWEEDGKQYMIARTQPFGTHTPVANCFVFASSGNSLSFATDSSCNRGVDPILSSYNEGFVLTTQPDPCPGVPQRDIPTHFLSAVKSAATLRTNPSPLTIILVYGCCALLAGMGRIH